MIVISKKTGSNLSFLEIRFEPRSHMLQITYLSRKKRSQLDSPDNLNDPIDQREHAE